MSIKTLLTALTVFTLPAAAEPDPILGVWKLNLARSSFNPSSAPRCQTRTYIETPKGIQVTIRSVGVNGRSSTIEFPERYDGRELPGSRAQSKLSSSDIRLQQAAAVRYQGIMATNGLLGR
jgi:hypothetical protein